MSPSTPYLFYEIWVPKRAPYQGPHGWPSICGDFLRPIMASISPYEDLAWIAQEGRWFQLCVATPNPREVARLIRYQCKVAGFRVRRILRGGTLGGALGGPRWNHPSRLGTQAEAERSVRLVQAMHCVCQLYVDSLVRVQTGKGRKVAYHWQVEPNLDRQNPHGSFMESFMHLVANVSEARFDLLMDVRTGWMPEPVRLRVPAHL